MTGFELSILWLIGLFPSLIFGWGGAVVWTIIMWIAYEKYDYKYPNRHGTRHKQESIDANNNLTPEELNYIDLNPSKYKTYWSHEYVFRDVNSIGDHDKYTYKYYRCNECGHVMKVLVWLEEPATPLPITNHWCRGCQDFKDVTETDEVTYEMENRYYRYLYLVMQYTKIENPKVITEIFNDYLKKAKRGVKIPFNEDFDEVSIKYSQDFQNRYEVPNGYNMHGVPQKGVSVVHFNGSPIATEKTLESNAFLGLSGLDDKERLERIVIAFKRLCQFDFYYRIFKDETMSMADYIKSCGKEDYLIFIDKNGAYNPPKGVEWDDASTLWFYKKGDYKGE